MFDNMSTIIFTQIHSIFVHFSLFWHRVIFTHFLSLKLPLLGVKMRKKKERQTFLPHIGPLAIFFVFFHYIRFFIHSEL